MSGRKWYEDWNLGITGYDNGMVRIEVSLPNNPTKQMYSLESTSKEDMILVANLLDKALSELTGTKEGLLPDGSDTAAPD